MITKMRICAQPNSWRSELERRGETQNRANWRGTVLPVGQTGGGGPIDLFAPISVMAKPNGINHAVGLQSAGGLLAKIGRITNLQFDDPIFNIVDAHEQVIVQRPTSAS
jgi:hypothetical protein